MPIAVIKTGMILKTLPDKRVVFECAKCGQTLASTIEQQGIRILKIHAVKRETRVVENTRHEDYNTKYHKSRDVELWHIRLENCFKCGNCIFFDREEIARSIGYESYEDFSVSNGFGPFPPYEASDEKRNLWERDIAPALASYWQHWAYIVSSDKILRTCQPVPPWYADGFDDTSDPFSGEATPGKPYHIPDKQRVDKTACNGI